MNCIASILFCVSLFFSQTAKVIFVDSEQRVLKNVLVTDSTQTIFNNESDTLLTQISNVIHVIDFRYKAIVFKVSDTFQRLQLIDVETHAQTEYIYAQRLFSKVLTYKKKDHFNTTVSHSSEYLNQLPYLSIIDYGAGGAKTLRFKGSFDRHSNILLEGISLNTSQNYWSFLNLVHPEMIESISISEGPSALYLGRNAIAGAVSFQTNDSVNSQLMVQFKHGFKSYDRRIQGIASQYFAKKNMAIDGEQNHFQTNIPLASNGSYLFKIGREFDANNYPYKYGSSYYTKTNSYNQSWYQTHQIITQLSTSLASKLSYFNTNLNSEISGPVSDDIVSTDLSNNHQKDAMRLFVLQLKYFPNSRHFLDLKSAYNEHIQRYKTVSSHDNYSRLLQINWYYGHSQFEHQMAISYRYNALFSSDISESHRIEKSLAFHPKYYYQDWKFSVNIRNDHVTDIHNKKQIFNDFSFAYSVSYQREKYRLSFHGAEQKAIPSFNDLYWPNGWGNPHLKNETNLSWQLSFIYEISTSHRIHVDIDNRNYSNLIRWVNQSTTLWRPINLDRVHQNTFSVIDDLNFTWINVRLNLNHSILYNNMIYESKQIPFTPLWTIKQNSQISYQNHTLNINQVFESEQRDYSDNSISKTNLLINVSYVHQWILSEAIEMESEIRIKNCLNNFVEIRKFYPLSNRSYEFQVNLKIKP